MSSSTRIAIDDVYAVFAELACRRGRVANARNDIGLEDFLGVDDESGADGPLPRPLPHPRWRAAQQAVPPAVGAVGARRASAGQVRGVGHRAAGRGGAAAHSLRTEARGHDITSGASGPTDELAFLMARTDRTAVVATADQLLDHTAHGRWVASGMNCW